MKNEMNYTNTNKGIFKISKKLTTIFFLLTFYLIKPTHSNSYISLMPKYILEENSYINNEDTSTIIDDNSLIISNSNYYNDFSVSRLHINKNNNSVLEDNYTSKSQCSCYFVDLSNLYTIDLSALARHNDLELLIPDTNKKIAYNLCGNTLVSDGQEHQVVLMNEDYSFKSSLSSSANKYNSIIYKYDSNRILTINIQMHSETICNVNQEAMNNRYNEDSSNNEIIYYKQISTQNDSMYSVNWNISCNKDLNKGEFRFINHNFNEEKTCEFKIEAESNDSK